MKEAENSELLLQVKEMIFIVSRTHRKNELCRQ